MKLIELKLRCYAKKEPDNSWYATCIDLNLFVQGDTLKEVKEKLESSMYEYVTEALTKDKNHIGDLIPRKTPLYFMLNYWVLLARHRVSHTLRETFFPYTNPMPLHPAHHKPYSRAHQHC